MRLLLHCLGEAPVHTLEAVAVPGNTPACVTYFDRATLHCNDLCLAAQSGVSSYDSWQHHQGLCEHS